MCLIKIGKQEYIEKLHKNGEVYMQRLSEYRGVEHSAQGDKYEGFSHIFQGRQVCLKINREQVHPEGAIYILESTLINPFVFCSFALQKHHLENNLNRLSKKLLDFGETALVITNIEEFYSRVQDNIAEQDTIEADLVSYINPETYHGDMGVFKKQDIYEYQSEFRIAVERESNEQYIKINLGSLEDISRIFSTKILLETLRLS